MQRELPYQTCVGPVQNRLRVKGSRFLAVLEPCSDRASADERLEVLRAEYRDATHVCWAWRLLSEPEPGEASSDAGEPSGTAGVPMLRVLQSHDLWNVLSVVVRWFGGTKLGRGGLVRAYRDCLSGAVTLADIIEVVPAATAIIRSPMENVGDLHRILSALEVSYLAEEAESDIVVITVSVKVRDLERLKGLVEDATRGGGSVQSL